VWSGSRPCLFTPEGKAHWAPCNDILQIREEFKNNTRKHFIYFHTSCRMMLCKFWCGNTWSWLISGSRKGKEELAVTGSSFERRKGKITVGGCLKDSGRCYRWSVPSVVAFRRRPDPQDSLSETDGGHSDRYLLHQQFESTNPGVAPTHTVQMINLPYIFAELNAETKRRGRVGCGINIVWPRIVLIM
jgi:hypothetical protein